MTTEEFLREYFGLKGAFYAEDGYEHIDEDPSTQFSKEAWELWGKALRMLEALEKEGYISDGKNGNYYEFFWECLPE